MTPKQFQRYLDRDGGCVHCGQREAVSPHHRLNRGMGGSKARDVPSNIVVLCSLMNGLIEAETWAAIEARGSGWKLSAGDKPDQVPLWDSQIGEWVLLADDYSRRIVDGPLRGGSH